ncbi:GNAT family N-acetyltransferase [Ferrovibrio sp.]|uniref:GNAT family N-acetyltransferase n=1 Tax=Ferrovibrio sp. TaxID=1917215 RepID=UPI0035B3AE44
MSDAIRCHAFTPARWDDLAALFGRNGACDGCWCMYWRHASRSDWVAAKGAANKRALKALLADGTLHGALAYGHDAEGASLPVGWVDYGPRMDYPKLGRARSLSCQDAEHVWSIPCFFIKAGWRRRGVASALLGFAVAQLRRQGAGIIEGYPRRAAQPGRRIAASDAWTGTIPMFEKAGFHPVGPEDGGKQRMRLQISARS